MILRVKATPNARKNEIIGWQEEPLLGKVLRVKIQSPPVEGKANKELVAFLSKVLKLSKSQVRLSKGATSRIKTLIIPDDTELGGL